MSWECPECHFQALETPITKCPSCGCEIGPAPHHTPQRAKLKKLMARKIIPLIAFACVMFAHSIFNATASDQTLAGIIKTDFTKQELASLGDGSFYNRISGELQTKEQFDSWFAKNIPVILRDFRAELVKVRVLEVFSGLLVIATVIAYVKKKRQITRILVLATLAVTIMVFFLHGFGLGLIGSVQNQLFVILILARDVTALAALISLCSLLLKSTWRKYEAL